MNKLPTIPYADKIIRSLADSYQDYPYPGGMIKDAERRKNVLPIIWREELKRIAKVVDITTESPAAKGVAIWCRLKDLKATSPVTLSQIISLFPFRTRLTEAYRTTLASNDIKRNRDALDMPDDTEYLYVLGVAPDAQHQGIGSELVLDRMKTTDAEGRGMYLETNTEHNVRFYERLGFTVLKEYHNPKTGITTWFMFHTPPAENGQ
ncbi:MAG TPA: GNAT family N-acetyltransferase [Methanocorpusculum sp.]|nr:GNAT family N-acetyltransferase [Methanocorpusculum sp.]